jgi:hypothetical protein
MVDQVRDERMTLKRMSFIAPSQSLVDRIYLPSENAKLNSIKFDSGSLH